MTHSPDDSDRDHSKRPNGSSIYRQVVMMLLGAVIVASIGTAGWLVRAEHDEVKGAAREALALGNLNREQIAVLRSQLESLNTGITEIQAHQEVIIANQSAILKELTRRNKE